MNKAYQDFLAKVKATIQSNRNKAIKQVSRSLIDTYWEIGQQIIENQNKHGWGKSIVEQLSKDLQKDFPGRTGLSTRNLWHMRKFYEIYNDFSNLKQLVSEIPWGHHILIMQK